MQEAFPYMAMLCTWGWSQSFLFVGGVSISGMCLLGECIHGQREGLVATCGSMLAELHVCGG